MTTPVFDVKNKARYINCDSIQQNDAGSTKVIASYGSNIFGDGDNKKFLISLNRLYLSRLSLPLLSKQSLESHVLRFTWSGLYNRMQPLNYDNWILPYAMDNTWPDRNNDRSIFWPSQAEVNAKQNVYEFKLSDYCPDSGINSVDEYCEVFNKAVAAYSQTIIDRIAAKFVQNGFTAPDQTKLAPIVFLQYDKATSHFKLYKITRNYNEGSYQGWQNFQDSTVPDKALGGAVNQYTHGGYLGFAEVDVSNQLFNMLLGLTVYENSDNGFYRLKLHSDPQNESGELVKDFVNLRITEGFMNKRADYRIYNSDYNPSSHFNEIYKLIVAMNSPGIIPEMQNSLSDNSSSNVSYPVLTDLIYQAPDSISERYSGVLYNSVNDRLVQCSSNNTNTIIIELMYMDTNGTIKPLPTQKGDIFSVKLCIMPMN